MIRNDPSLRLRPWAALLMFASAYSPLLIILIIKDYDPNQFSLLPRHPVMCIGLLLVAIASCIGVLRAIQNIRSGLTVEVTKAANKSGEMFGYSIHQGDDSAFRAIREAPERKPAPKCKA